MSKHRKTRAERDDLLAMATAAGVLETRRPRRIKPRRSELVGSPQILPRDAAYRHLCERAEKQNRRDKYLLLIVALVFIAECAAAGMVVAARGGLVWML